MLQQAVFDQLKVEVYQTRAEMGTAAGHAIAEYLRELLEKKSTVNMIFAAAPSQNETLETLAAAADIDWSRVNAFHMDEYVGLPSDAPQGFGNFLKSAIFSKLPFRAVYYIDGNAPDIEAECARYAALLEQNRTDIVCMGIGENGHLAFNDPHVADFHDPVAVKEVILDQMCRAQQVNDGCFTALEEVPTKALTLTMPTLTRVPKIFCMVPAKTKAQAVLNTLTGEISERTPASILRMHPDATLYCDSDSYSMML